MIIGIGLGILCHVRSEANNHVGETLASSRYFEHGGFYVIIALAIAMFLDTMKHVSGGGNRADRGWLDFRCVSGFGPL